MKGFTRDKKFHPIRDYIPVVRKKRSPATLEGVKIIKKVNPRSIGTKEMIRGITESFSEQSKTVRDKINTITFKEKDPTDDWVAKVDTTNGKAMFNLKPNMREGDYKALGDHEFEHIDFNMKLESGNKKYEQFIKDAHLIKPFTPNLMVQRNEMIDAYIEGNFGILPDKRLEYPDEINSIVMEIETRQKLGLPVDILDEDEFESAKRLVENLHSDQE